MLLKSKKYMYRIDKDYHNKIKAPFISMFWVIKLHATYDLVISFSLRRFILVIVFNLFIAVKLQSVLKG